MSLALFVDDRRNPPPGNWTIARTSAVAIAILAIGQVTYLSLDYDLGDKSPGLRDSGLAVVEWLAARMAQDTTFVLPVWRIHSNNPEGSLQLRKMLLALAQAHRD
jgi:hypothetical protein